MAKKADKKKRNDVAALCGLVLRRLQEIGVGDPQHDTTAITVSDLNQIFGEALQQFSGKSEDRQISVGDEGVSAENIS